MKNSILPVRNSHWHKYKSFFRRKEFRNYNDFKQHPKVNLILKWIKLISITGSAQIIVQATGLISGILVIRLLPTNEYALYTLANTMLGTMTVLADGGIGSGVMAQGGKVWQDKKKLGSVLATGLDLRKKFAVGSLLIAVPILGYLLLHHGASWLTTILIILALIPAFFAALSDSLLEIPSKLHQDITPLQKNQVNVSIGRLFLTGLTLFVFPWTFIAIIAAGIPRIYGNVRLREISNKFLDNHQSVDPKVRSEILTVMKRMMPGAIYYCVSGQISIWIISIFGTTEAIAQIGALGRLSMLLTLIGILFSTLLEPRFARLPDNQNLLLKNFFKIQITLLIICSSILSSTLVFPKEILFILGKNYSDLTTELFVMVLGSCLSTIAGITYKLNASRGIVANPVIFFSLIITTQVLTLYFLDTSKLINVLWFSVFPPLVGILFRFAHFIVFVRHLKPSENEY